MTTAFLLAVFASVGLTGYLAGWWSRSRLADEDARSFAVYVKRETALARATGFQSGYQAGQAGIRLLQRHPAFFDQERV